MLPNVVGPGTFPQPSMSSGATARAEQGAQPFAGETAASGARPETFNRVDPPRALPNVIGLRDQERRPPPDPDGPAGPPPTFDATPLQRERERVLAAMNLLPNVRGKPVEAQPPAEAKVEAKTPARADGATAPEPAERTGKIAEAKPRPDTKPDAEAIERLETEVAEVRRMAEPEPERGVDLVL